MKTKQEIKEFLTDIPTADLPMVIGELKERLFIPIYWDKGDFPDLTEKEYESLVEYTYAGDECSVEDYHDGIVSEWESRSDKDWVEDEEEDE